MGRLLLLVRVSLTFSLSVARERVESTTAVTPMVAVVVLVECTKRQVFTFPLVLTRSRLALAHLLRLTPMQGELDRLRR
jgi:hypothetical protein